MNKKLSNQKVLQIFGQIAQNLQKNKLLTSQEKILLTVSGGQDSICLLIIFFLLRTQLLISFDLLFCHHFWQKSSFFTMLHVAKCNFCCSSKILFFFPLDRLLSEKAARDWRHKVIQRTTLFYGYTTATQAHTKSDRIETILFNLIRGTGLTGVATLQFQHTQSLFSYNKFYPVTLLLSDSHFSDSLKYAECKNLDPARGSDFDNPFLAFPSPLKRISLTPFWGQTLHSQSHTGVRRRGSDTSFGGKTGDPKLTALPLDTPGGGQKTDPYRFNNRYIYDCLSVYILPLFYTPLYTFVTIGGFDFFTTIRNTKIVKLVTQLTILSFALQKVPFGYPLPSRMIRFDSHRIIECEEKGKQQKVKKKVSATKSKTTSCSYVTLKLIGKSNTKINNKCVTKIQMNTELRTYKTYYNQLKQLTDLR